jgi:pyruvate,water dikinase
MPRYIVELDSKLALKESWAGGKGAGLARLRRRGFNVPPGFVITTDAFRDFLIGSGVTALVQPGPCTERDLALTQAFLMARRIPDRLASSMVKAYRRLTAPVAVRSSMPGEDADTTSFAGQLETVLNVEGEEDFLESVKSCWASVFSRRVLSYLAEHGLAAEELPDAFAMAVVVQQMVDAEAAGVAFSADPLTGRRCVIIEAARGLGDGVVQGRVETDRYIVDARGVLSEASLVHAEAPVLHDEQILRLSRLVYAVATEADAPQDIEWAWNGHTFYLLQSRPITSLVGKRIYSNKMVSDMSPGLIKPLVYSTKTVAMTQNVFGRLFTQLIGPNEIDFTSLATRIHSRIYTDMTLLGELLEQIGLPANFFEVMARDERAAMRYPPLTPRTLRTIWRLLGFARRHANVADEIAAFNQRHDQALEAYRDTDWAARSPQERLAAFDRLLSLHGECQWYIFIGLMNSLIRKQLLDRLVKRWAPDVIPADLIRGLVGLKALEPNRELRQLAARASALDEASQRILTTADDAAIRDALSQSPEGRALLRGVEGFMDRYGFLSINGTDFTEMPWIETPTLIWHAIGRAAAHPGDIAPRDARAIREETRRQARDQLNGLQRLIFNRLLSATITYIELRERTSLLMSEDSYHMRRIFMALADPFITRGHLTQREDIFYLTYEEVQRLVNDALSADAARELVTTRRAAMRADARIELPETICGESPPAHTTTLTAGQDQLVGIGGSSGIAEGHARIVRAPAEAPVSLGRNDILVVPFTDVGWTPLFPGIGGIVAETGGQLSHTAIVAREYGLPAVVGIKQATRLIEDGQPITINGYSGQVYLHRRAVD